MKAIQERKPLSVRKYALLWSTRALTVDLAISLFGYTFFFVTDVLGLPPAILGVILIASKAIDGFIDLFWGYLIDRTKTKLGKGRPYELALIGYLASGVIIFATPHMTVGLMLFFYFIMYNLRQSVFSSLFYCAEPVYFVNSIPDKTQAPKILSIRGTVCGIVAIPFGVLLPQLVDWAGRSQERWVIMGLALAVPLALIGLLRFFFIPEISSSHWDENDKFRIKDIIAVLKQNKYALIYTVVIFITYLLHHVASETATFYAKYVLGDLGVLSLLAIAGLSALLVTILIPFGAKKLGMTGYFKLCMILSILGNLFRLIDPRSVTITFIGGIFSACAIYPFWGVISYYLMECMDYGEWKTGKRIEGVYSSLINLSSNIATGIGIGMAGVILGMFGYNAALEVQSISAQNAMIANVCVIPMVFSILALIALHFYDVEKLMPKIRADLAERRAKKTENL